MPEYTYRAIYLCHDTWAVRRFSSEGCQETVFGFIEEGDRESRAFERKVVELAKTKTDWRKV